MSNVRVITIFSSRGDKTAKIETDATTWGVLRGLIREKGYEVDKLHASENIGKTTLEHEGAVLPEGNFTIFMRPKQTKSGAKKRADGMKLADLKKTAKEDIAAFPNMGKAHYGAYSTLKAEPHTELVNSFKGSAAKEKAATLKETASAPKKAPANASTSSTSKAKKVAEPKSKAEPKKAPAKNSKTEEVETESQMTARLRKEAQDFERGLK